VGLAEHEAQDQAITIMATSKSRTLAAQVMVTCARANFSEFAFASC